MSPTPAQLRALRGLAQDEAKAYLDFDPPTNTVWQHWTLRAISERLQARTFHALLRNGWIEENGWPGSFCSVIYGLSDAGRAVAEKVKP